MLQDQKAVLTRFRELKLQMNVSREAERRHLTTLTLQSDTAMKALQQTQDKVGFTVTVCESDKCLLFLGREDSHASRDVSET